MRYPRHRRMGSFNRRYTGTSNKDFNLRHDWNSLLSHDDSLLFRHYSSDLLPHADAYVRYLQDFQRKIGIKVSFFKLKKTVSIFPKLFSRIRFFFNFNFFTNHYTL